MFASVMPGLANLKDGAFVDTNVAMWRASPLALYCAT